jgi:hypothetical protein
VDEDLNLPHTWTHAPPGPEGEITDRSHIAIVYAARREELWADHRPLSTKWHLPNVCEAANNLHHLAVIGQLRENRQYNPHGLFLKCGIARCPLET